MNARRTILSWLDGILIHLPCEFSFAYMETTANRDVASQRPTWGEYFMTLAGRVRCRSKDTGAAAKDVLPEWDDYFMGMAKLASLRSKDPNTKVYIVAVQKHYLVNSTVLYILYSVNVTRRELSYII